MREFKAAEVNLDIINIYSYFYINCVQKTFAEGTLLNPAEAESFYLSILESLSLILKSILYLLLDYFDNSKNPCKKTINMVLEMIFQIVCTSNLSISNDNSIAIIETMTSRVLDGPNLCLFTLTLVYLYSFQDKYELEDEFFTCQKVNMANKTLITLFKYFHLVILELGEQDLALTFVRQVIGSSSEVCQQNISTLGYNELALISKARQKPTTAELKDFSGFIEGVSEGKPKTKQFAIFADTLKKAYYTIAVKVLQATKSRKQSSTTRNWRS